MSEQVTGGAPALSMIAPAGPLDGGWFDVEDREPVGRAESPGAPLAEDPGPLPSWSSADAAESYLGAEALARDDAGRDVVRVWLEMRPASRRVIRAAWRDIAGALDRLSALHGFPINDEAEPDDEPSP